MNSFHRLFLACLIVGGALLASSHLEAAPSHFVETLSRHQQQTIVVYGTSLTANSCWPTGLKQALCRKYGRRAKVINAAKGGMDSRWGYANLWSRVICRKPDAVFIEFSINDSLASSKLSVDEAMWNLKTMIRMIRAELPNCEVIVMIMNPPTGDSLLQRPHYADYAAGYRRIAKSTRCQLVDFSSGWNWLIKKDPAQWAAYAPDGLHPNKRAAREVIVPRLLAEIGVTP